MQNSGRVKHIIQVATCTLQMKKRVSGDRVPGCVLTGPQKQGYGVWPCLGCWNNIIQIVAQERTLKVHMSNLSSLINWESVKLNYLVTVRQSVRDRARPQSQLFSTLLTISPWLHPYVLVLRPLVNQRKSFPLLLWIPINYSMLSARAQASPLFSNIPL